MLLLRVEHGVFVGIGFGFGVLFFFLLGSLAGVVGLLLFSLSVFTFLFSVLPSPSPCHLYDDHLYDDYFVYPLALLFYSTRVYVALVALSC